MTKVVKIIGFQDYNTKMNDKEYKGKVIHLHKYSE